jgi:hypothetical protein
MTRLGGAGRGSGSKGCRGAEHAYDQTCTKDCTGAVALRAALESDVQLGRGNEVNRQEMANPTKCRDSLQACMTCEAALSSRAQTSAAAVSMLRHGVARQH